MLIYTLLYILEILICTIQLLELQGRCLINLLLLLLALDWCMVHVHDAGTVMLIICHAA